MHWSRQDAEEFERKMAVKKTVNIILSIVLVLGILVILGIKVFGS